MDSACIAAMFGSCQGETRRFGVVFRPPTKRPVIYRICSDHSHSCTSCLV